MKYSISGMFGTFALKIQIKRDTRRGEQESKNGVDDRRFAAVVGDDVVVDGRDQVEKGKTDKEERQVWVAFGPKRPDGIR